MKNLIQLLIIFFVGLSVKAQTTYYISSSAGNDANSGTSSAAPWKTLKTKVRGNTYAFKCNDTFTDFIPLIAISGTTMINFISYGTGAKPVLSRFSTIKATAWTPTATNNVWQAVITSSANVTGWVTTKSNCGFIRLNRAAIHGDRKFTKAGLNSQWQFYCDFGGSIFVYSVGKPSTLSGSIEVSNDDLIVNPGSYEYFYNLRMEGCSRVGMLMNNVSSHTTVRSCDIVYIGGQCKNATDSTRQGAGLNVDAGGNNIWVDSCYFKQIYECALTMQSKVTNTDANTNVRFSNNITDSCESSFNPTIQTGPFGFINCRVDHNLFQNEGWSWSHDIRPKDNQATTFINNGVATTQWDLTIDSNVIFNPREGLYMKDIPPYTNDYNDITINPNIYIMKTCAGCPQQPYKLATKDAFITATGQQEHSTWHSTLDVVQYYTYYKDLDQDNYGDVNGDITTTSATPPTGYVTTSTDCNDSDAAINPGETELCDDDIDNDCDGSTDEGCVTPVLPEVNLTSSAYTTRESKGRVTITFRMSKTYSTDVFVSFTLVNGTALLNSDYLDVPGVNRVRIPAGSSSCRLTIDIVKSLNGESDEDFIIQLSDPINATIGSGDNATIVIID